MKKFFIFVLLFAAAFAGDYENDVSFIQASTSHLTISTDMLISSGFDLSLYSGTLTDGDLNYPEYGITVCSGSRLTLTPTIEAKWAVSTFEADAHHPPGCASDPDYSSSECSFTSQSEQHNIDINWLSSSTFNDYVSTYSSSGGEIVYIYYEGENLDEVQEMYEELGPYTEQPVDYTIVYDSSTYSNKEGEVAIDCMGTLDINYGTGTTSRNLPSLSSVTTGTLSEGTYTFETELTDADCFGSILTAPNTFEEGHDYYYYYLQFYAGTRPTIRDGSASSTIEVTVADDGGTCSLSQGEPIVSSVPSLQITPLTDALTLVSVLIDNTGNDVDLSDVISVDNSAYTVEPFPEGIDCVSDLGADPSARCPTENNFEALPGDLDNPRGNLATRVYMLVNDTDPDNNNGGMTITLTGTVSDPPCGDPATCTVDIDLEGATDCTIAPSSVEVPQDEQQEFVVSCTDFDGGSTDCDRSGYDWAWDSGDAFGTVDEEHRSYALATPTAAVGTSDEMEYTSSSANCEALVTITSSLSTVMACEIVPSSAEVEHNTAARYDAICTNAEGGETNCTSTDWQWVDGFGVVDETYTGAETYAMVHADGEPGAEGTLYYYASENVSCSATMILTDADPETGIEHECDLTPDDLTTVMEQTTHFDLDCYLDDVVTDVYDPNYTLQDGLEGSLENEAADGVDYVAPSIETTGSIQASATFPDGVVAYDRSTVTVVPNTATACEIVPSSAEVEQNAGARYDVTCTNVEGTEVECLSVNWDWNDGFEGYVPENYTGFDAYAIVWSPEEPGTTGTLSYYASDSVVCSATMTVTSEDPETGINHDCDLVPDDVIINQGESQHFNMTCYVDLVETVPEDYDYSLVDDLDGSLENETYNGVDYGAPSTGTDGSIESSATFDDGITIYDRSDVIVVDEGSSYACEITPSSFEMGPYEWATYTVACDNYYGEPVDCEGDNWYWGDGLTGGFLVKTNTYTEAYSTSSVGNSGKLYYESATGANCSSDLTLIEPTYICDLSPDEVTMNYSELQEFNLECTVNGTADTPEEYEYTLDGDLGGELDNPAPDGVDYTSPNYDTTGNLTVKVTYDTGTPLGGAVDISLITVSNSTEECVGEGCYPGDSDYCRLLVPYPWEIPEGSTAYAPIGCGADGYSDCPSDLEWSVTDSAELGETTPDGASISVTGSAGDTGILTATYTYIGGISNGATCSREFTITETECVDYS